MAKHLQNRDKTYTASGALDLNNSIHICNSASAITLTVGDGSTGDRISITNKGAGTVTLTGNISTTTATKVLYEGESIELFWNSTEWI